MPAYDFQCAVCNETVEVVHSIHEKTSPTHPCPKCGYMMARVYNSSPAISFKGGGFYSTGG